MNALEIYVLLLPFIILGMALGVIWLTGRMDRHDERHHSAAERNKIHSLD
jgi:hypothetical protein